ncbi:MAG: N-acylneuraminate cytidylyltransferase [Elusimicrobiota bacterium]
MTLGVIPARGGSKGVPRKNLREVLGKPLIYWSIKAAAESALLDDFVVSTEDAEIARVARSFGAKVLKRPQRLASDETTTLSVLRHVLEHFRADTLAVLQPTSPIRDGELVDACLKRFRKKKANSLATGYYCKFLEYGSHNNLRRQDYKGFFYDDGNVYVVDAGTVLAGRWTGDVVERYLLDGDYNFEIDTELDLFIVEKLMEKRLVDGLKNAPKPVRLLALDVDGVLTDAGMYYTDAGEAMKKFNTRDGKGLELLRKRGFKTAFITAEETGIVERRAQKLLVDFLHQGVKDKLPVLRGIARKMRISLDQVAYVGDDVNDLSVLKEVGFAATPSNGCIEAKRIAHYVCRKAGGAGCVREVCDLILSALEREPDPSRKKALTR